MKMIELKDKIDKCHVACLGDFDSRCPGTYMDTYAYMYTYPYMHTLFAVFVNIADSQLIISVEFVQEYFYREMGRIPKVL